MECVSVIDPAARSVDRVGDGDRLRLGQRTTAGARGDPRLLRATATRTGRPATTRSSRAGPPLPDTDHSHAGWTWGSFGGVYAENPDRIWVAMRGELPLPPGAAPWTPYVALQPPRGNSTGNGDGITATCQPEPKRGWERRFQHSIVFNGAGDLVDQWPHLDKLFAHRACGRGPHQIKISPYDKEKHVWIIDDQLHVIYRFTYDGKAGAHARRARKERSRSEYFDRPTTLRGCLTGRISSATATAARASRSSGPTTNSSWTGAAARRSEEPGPNEWNTVHSIAISADRKLFVVDRGHAHAGVRRERQVPRHVAAAFARLAGEPEHADGEPLHRRQGIHLGGRCADRSNPKFDQKGNFLYSWGAPGRRRDASGARTE